MYLPSPIIVQPKTSVKTDGTVREYPAIRLHELDVTILDNSKNKMVLAQIRGIPRYLTLWQDEGYDAAGDYTQAQAEARLLEVLGDDPKSTLENLYETPQPPMN